MSSDSAKRPNDCTCNGKQCLSHASMVLRHEGWCRDQIWRSTSLPPSRPAKDGLCPGVELAGPTSERHPSGTPLVEDHDVTASLSGNPQGSRDLTSTVPGLRLLIRSRPAMCTGIVGCRCSVGYSGLHIVRRPLFAGHYPLERSWPRAIYTDFLCPRVINLDVALHNPWLIAFTA